MRIKRSVNALKKRRAILKQAISQGIHELYFENTDVGLSVNFKSPHEIIQTGKSPLPS